MSTTNVGVTVRKGTNGRLQAVGVVNVGHLVDHYRIPHRNTSKKTGYQRPLSTTRVNKLAADLRRGHIDLPTAVLLNIRDFNPADLVPVGDAPDLAGGPPGNLYMLRLADYDLWVVDGQHRTAGLEKVCQENPDRWRNYVVPFVCTLGSPEHEELEQFYVVNSTAKSVATDLAYDLLSSRAANNRDLYDTLVAKRENWKVDGQTLAEALRETRLWKGRIRMSDEPPAGTTIKSAAMVSSLRPVLNHDYFSILSHEKRVAILTAFWEGIAQVLPGAFENSGDYAVQKSNGTLVLHEFLPAVLEVVRSSGRSVLDAGAYAEVLADPLEHLEGSNAEGEPVSGLDFWEVGSGGAAGAFTSNSGRRVLVNRLKRLLPEPDVE